jgi:hypothetical protein
MKPLNRCDRWRTRRDPGFGAKGWRLFPKLGDEGCVCQDVLKLHLAG